MTPLGSLLDNDLLLNGYAILIHDKTLKFYKKLQKNFDLKNLSFSGSLPMRKTAKHSHLEDVLHCKRFRLKPIEHQFLTNDGGKNVFESIFKKY